MPVRLGVGGAPPVGVSVPRVPPGDEPLLPESLLRVPELGLEDACVEEEGQGRLQQEFPQEKQTQVQVQGDRQVPNHLVFFWNNTSLPRTTISQDVQTRFSMLLAFAKFLSKIKGNF